MSTATEGTPGGAAPDPTLMDPAIARDWTLWSPLVGRTAMTRIESAATAVPELTSAILATADGLRICSLGLEDDDADRLAALNGSLFGVARAEARIVASAEDEAQVLDPERGGGLARMFGTAVSLTVGDTHTVVHSLVVPPFGQLLLGVSAREVQLGTLMVTARQAAREVAYALGESTSIN